MRASEALDAFAPRLHMVMRDFIEAEFCESSFRRIEAAMAREFAKGLAQGVLELDDVPDRIEVGPDEDEPKVVAVHFYFGNDE